MSEAITNAISVLCDCRDALRECDRDGDYKLINLIDDTCAALSQTAPLDGEVTDEQLESCSLAAGFSYEPATGATWAVDGYSGMRVDPGLRKFARAILALRPQAESKTYADGTTATGVAPLPDVSPAEHDAIQAEGLLNDLEAMLGGRSGASIKLRSLIRPLRPQAVPMTDEVRRSYQCLLAMNTPHGFGDRIGPFVKWLQDLGITAKAEGGA